MDSTEFWNDIYAQSAAEGDSLVELPNMTDPVLNRALTYFGDVRGHTLIDIGSGRGAASLFFASHGARVISIDLSEVATRNLAAYCRSRDIVNVETHCMAAHELQRLGKVDFIFGSMILHHIEPFEEFARILRATLRPHGKAFFWENNARSSIMIWFRRNIVGRFWIPKYGDDEEFPLMPSEIDELRNYFDVKVEYPYLLLFTLISVYVLRNRFKWPFERLDKFLYRYPSIRQYSYRQYLLLE